LFRAKFGAFWKHYMKSQKEAVAPKFGMECYEYEAENNLALKPRAS
jgi:hypothetical protein